MNTASRMESTCTPGLIQVSESTWQLLKHVDQWRSTGGIEVKGKGLMNTYYLIDPEGRPQTNDNVTDAIDLSGGYIME
jgi:class 3 adenylate cyclase